MKASEEYSWNDKGVIINAFNEYGGTETLADLQERFPGLQEHHIRVYHDEFMRAGAANPPRTWLSRLASFAAFVIAALPATWYGAQGAAFVYCTFWAGIGLSLAATPPMVIAAGGILGVVLAAIVTYYGKDIVSAGVEKGKQILNIGGAGDRARQVRELRNVVETAAPDSRPATTHQTVTETRQTVTDILAKLDEMNTRQQGIATGQQTVVRDINVMKPQLERTAEVISRVHGEKALEKVEGTPQHPAVAAQPQ